MKATCVECDLTYWTATAAEYCAEADGDPSKENDLLRRGLMSSAWVPKPLDEQRPMVRHDEYPRYLGKPPWGR